jgi:hypothetical protein
MQQIKPTLYLSRPIAPPTALPSHPAAPALTVPVFANRPITGSAPLRVEVAMPSAQQLAGMNRVEVDMSLGCPPPGRDACELMGCCGWRVLGCIQS